MKHFIFWLLVSQMFFGVSAVVAYEVPTHRILSREAVNASLLKNDPNVLSHLGLKPLEEKQKFPNSEETPGSIIDLVQDGAEFEDNFPRYFQHFYDSINEQSIDFPLVPGLLPFSLRVHR